MITATSTAILEQMGSRYHYAVTLSDGRTFKTHAKTEKEAIKTILKHVNATPVAEQEAAKSAITASDIYHMGTGVWSYEFANAMAEIAAKSTGIAVDISAKFKQYHTISPAQAQVLARVAEANNITL